MKKLLIIMVLLFVSGIGYSAKIDAVLNEMNSLKKKIELERDKYNIEVTKDIRIYLNEDLNFCISRETNYTSYGDYIYINYEELKALRDALNKLFEEK